jgi:hypothetical protein
VIIPACNEAGKIERTVAALLQTSYPRLELIVVDDRSTDGTGAIVDELAAGDGRVRALHVTELPEGWLGKVHALQVGLAAARGEWIVFADADVQLAPWVLGAALAHALEQRLDFLTALPRFTSSGSLFLDAAVASMVRAVFIGGQVWKLADPGSDRGGGFGALNLIRRAALERTEGLEWLRLEVADDVGLGLLLKRGGSRCAFVNARDALSLCFYEDLGELARSVEKGGYAIVGRYSAPRAVVMAAALILLDTAHLLALVPTGLPWLPLVGLAGLAAGAAASVIGARWVGIGAGAGLLTVVGSVTTALLVVRSALLGWRRGGVRWRETFYPAEVLRPGRRVRWP